MTPGADPTSDRKRRHLELALAPTSQSPTPAGWDDVHLIPRSLPGVSPADVDLACTWFGETLAAPLMLAGMTGGHPDATEINAVLGEAAEEVGIPVGVGSQRAALIDPTLAPTFAAIRARAPHAFVVANLGASQLVDQDESVALGSGEVARAIEMVRADALAVHLNVVQELVQPEGDRRLHRLLDGIRSAVGWSSVPVLAKETGAGMDRDSAVELVDAGIAALDVGGRGGTSFARIEASRAADVGEASLATLGTVFADWGISTAASLIETRAIGVPVIATGGVRSGLDVAKALAMGASLVGIGRPALLAAQRGTAELVGVLEQLMLELRTAMVMSGARLPADLSARPPVLTGHTAAWAAQRDTRGTV